MKKPKTSTMVAAAAIAIGLSTAGMGVIHAASSTTGQNNPINNLVTAISQKFNLNQSDVQQVFDQQKQQMQAQHQQRFADRLTQDVKDGKLTQTQADAISAKMTELQTQRQADQTSLQGKTQAERQAYFKQQADALKQWATDNNIPAGYIPFGGPMMGRGHEGFGMGMRHGPDGDQDDQPQVVAPSSSTSTQ